MRSETRQTSFPFADFDGTLTFSPPVSSSDRKQARLALYHRYANKLSINRELNRSLVSFQANRKTPFYRWLKYKEGFSSELVQYFLEKFRPSSSTPPRILDPFAGAGTTLTTAAKSGWHATGIELLPVGVASIRARLSADRVNVRSFQHHLRRLESFPLEAYSNGGFRFPHLRITEKAFPAKTEKALSGYFPFLEAIKDKDVHFLFWFACLAVLEDIGYTRKDGQYLRWDFRSGRALKSKFNKGVIHDFRTAVTSKLQDILWDIMGRNGGICSRHVKVIEGSCLSELPRLPDNRFNLAVTSPPYCNRYDYTRTYALELAFMNHDETAIKNLRQELLSCTVENKCKRQKLAGEYAARKQESRYLAAVEVFDKQSSLREVLGLLHKARDEGNLNNNNIPALVENYFFEMNLVIRELSRVLAPGGAVVMVNDNVQYNGEEIPVDLILSDFAAKAGLNVDHIWVLPRGKGNSSQQMGIHGRNEIRKCVYVWTKPPE